MIATSPALLMVKSATGSVRVGAATESTVMVRASVDVLPDALVAEIGTWYVPTVVGVPAMVPVPFPLSVKVIPGGDDPGTTRARAGAGKPVVVMLYVPATPVLKVAVLGLVIVGASSLVSVKL